MQILFDGDSQLKNQVSGQLRLLRSLSGNYTTYQWRKGIPRQECDHETKAGEEENSAISINWVEDGNG
jgi:hypothetical protein